MLIVSILRDIFGQDAREYMTTYIIDLHREARFPDDMLTATGVVPAMLESLSSRGLAPARN